MTQPPNQPLTDSDKQPTTPLQARTANVRLVVDLNQLHPDQICVYAVLGEGDDSQRILIYIIEYKAPHKLTQPHLRMGLRHGMDIKEEVDDRATRPLAGDTDGIFQYHSERVTVAAVCQTYHCMIEAGLEYSYLTTGESVVFFKIDWKNPEKLCFHLAEPVNEVDARPDNEDAIHCTMISQVLVFTLLAIRAEKHGQDERARANRSLKVWGTDYNIEYRNIPESERKSHHLSRHTSQRTTKL